MLKATATAAVPAISKKRTEGISIFKEEILSVFVYSFLSRSMARMNPML